MRDNKEVALSLITAASWLMEHEGDWQVSISNYGDTPVIISQWVDETYDYERNDPTVSALENLTALRRSLGGQWDKHTTDYEFRLSQKVNKYITVQLSVSRETACDAKVVGTETVEVKDYDNCPTKTITRDVIEYDCKPILS